MADVIVDELGLQNIANSLRYKLNTSNTFLPSEMGPAVNNIPIASNYEITDAKYLFYYGARENSMNDIIALCNNVSDVREMFYRFRNLTDAPFFNTHLITSMINTFKMCYNLVNVPQYNTTNITDMRYAFSDCNNLSNAAIQNIINMCLNSNITEANYMNLNNAYWFSPFYISNISNTRYQNRWSELTAAGWSY